MNIYRDYYMTFSITIMMSSRDIHISQRCNRGLIWVGEGGDMEKFMY